MTQSIKKIALICLLLASSSGAAWAEQKSDKSTICAVSCIDPDVSADSQSVVDVLKAITKALADHDYVALASYFDPNCTTYDEKTKKLVVGRDNIVSDVKAKVAAEEARLKAPPISYTIDHPYVIVTGSQAVVTFVLVKEIGGEHPARFESHCSDVFVKRDGQWKKLHFCGEGWKENK